MRPRHAIAAALLLAAAFPAASYADGYPPIPPAPGAAVNCPCPPRHHVWRPVRHVRHHARHWVPGPLPPPVNAWFDAPVPSPWDSAYDRAMVLAYRSPAVSGIVPAEPGYPPTPAVHGVHYRIVEGDKVLDYDGMADGYVPLSLSDARRVLAAVPPPPVPAAPR